MAPLLLPTNDWSGATWSSFNSSSNFYPWHTSTTSATSDSVYYWAIRSIADSRPNLAPSPRALAEDRLNRTRALGQRIEMQRSRGERVLDASARGKVLLQEIIGDVLYRRLERRGFVDLPSIKFPDIRYRIRYNRQIGIVRKVGPAWEEGKEHLCIHPDYRFVAGDKAATHAILCMFDEDMLWRTANHNRWAA